MAFEKVTNRERLARKIVKKKGTKAVRKHLKRNPHDEAYRVQDKDKFTELGGLKKGAIKEYKDNLDKVRSDAEEKARKKNIIVKILNKRAKNKPKREQSKLKKELKKRNWLDKEKKKYEKRERKKKK
tara:strand:+ start:547 stop:927 length:381 start_codon:yes stop_codon:yes gene_type:complete